MQVDHSYSARWGILEKGLETSSEDLSLDPDFDALKAEVGKDFSLHDTQKTDWAAVLEMADGLLSRSKDLWVFSYGVIALHHTKGLADSTEALCVLTGLIRQTWEALLPPVTKIQRRLAPLKWLNDRLVSLAANTKFHGEKPEQIEALRKALADLQAALDEQCQDNGLRFSSVFAGITPPTPPPKDKKSEPASEGTTQDAGHSSQGIGAAMEKMEQEGVIPPAILQNALRQCGDFCRQVGIHFLTKDILDERAYYLNRASCWNTITSQPTADAKQCTAFSCSVPPEKISQYVSLVEKKQFVQVLPLLERAVSMAPFWLDGHRLVVRCLEGLNAQPAASTVKLALCQLVGRFPNLLSLHFRDGTPFASAETIAWIEDLLQSPLGGGQTLPGQMSLNTGASVDDDEAIYREALSVAKAEGIRAGFAVLGSIPPGKTRRFI